MIALVLVGFVLARQVLTPMMNRARDAELRGDSVAGQRFKRLHKLSVILNAAQWIAIVVALWPLLL